MDSDGPLKVLFHKYAPDLLPLTGDAGARVESAGAVEIQALKRRVDCVLALDRDGERYYRHVEFQAEPDPDMPTRCFRYNTQLVLQYGAPVLSTVLYLLPPRPKREPVFRVMFAGREINRWVFEEVCLFELDAKAVVASGAPGLLALVPLMRGGRRLAVVEESARRIERAFPSERLPGAEDVLLALASRFYTVSELVRIVGRDRMWQQSSLYVEGKLEGARETCAALARKHHAAVFDLVESMIAACDDPARLKEWNLAASDLSDAEFLALVSTARPTPGASSRVSRSRSSLSRPRSSRR